MKITIDTKEDSAEDIRKVISLLSSLSGEHIHTAKSSNIFEDSSPSLGNVFGAAENEQSDQPVQLQPVSSVNEPPSASPAEAFANLFGDANDAVATAAPEQPSAIISAETPAAATAADATASATIIQEEKPPLFEEEEPTPEEKELASKMIVYE